MGLLERAIRRGISEGVGRAVGSAVERAVAPKAAEFADKTAAQLDGAAANPMPPAQRATGSLEGAFANLQRAAQGYATEMSKNMKLCPACGQPAAADKKFCPACGTKLPEETVAQGAVCPNCGRQNSLGTKFCADCGTKLPAAVAEEAAAQQQNAAAMAQWAALLPGFPQWNGGGTDYQLETLDGQGVAFAVTLPSGPAAQGAVQQYRALLQQNGFATAGQYPDPHHLYKRDGGLCCHVDTEHCFEGDANQPTIYFTHEEPYGGFDAQRPEPKKQASFLDLFT